MRRIAIAIALLLATSSTARAWDPSRTHVGITERAAAKSELHSRWMEGSAKRRGWFTPLRIDPRQLDGETRRLLVLAMRRAHADTGSIAGGGPGACPPTPAPAETRQRCVEGDVWETTALGWVRIGIALEVADRDRLLHHFVDPDAPGKPRWKARGDAKARWRRVERRAGGPLAARVGRSGFSGQGTSAIGWLDDSRDPFAPPAMHEHLVQASLAASATERDRHFALAMVGVGALLHVVQDLGMPAHARGDLAALIVPLSPELGDRGSPLAEAARLAFGRAGLPEPLALGGRPPDPAEHAIEDLHALLLGDADDEGIAPRAAQRFLSDGSLPRARVLHDDVDAETAARQLLGDDRAGLLPVEVEGAVLAPWPADAGYLRNGAGRALAAWSRDEDDLVRPYLDRHVLRQQALALLPVAVEASVRALDLLFPAWPASSWDAQSDVLELDADPALHDAELAIMSERGDGTRALLRRVKLLPERSRIRDVTPATLAKDAVIVLVMRARRADGMAIVIERRLDAAVPSPVEPEPDAELRPSEPVRTSTEPGQLRPRAPTSPTGQRPTGEPPSGGPPGSKPPQGEPPKGEPPTSKPNGEPPPDEPSSEAPSSEAPSSEAPSSETVEPTPERAAPRHSSS